MKRNSSCKPMSFRKKLIQDGQLIRVHGTEGYVEIIESRGGGRYTLGWFGSGKLTWDNAARLSDAR